MTSIISQIELARLSGASKQSVNKAIKAGHIKVNKKRKVIFDDPLTQLWLEKQGSKNVDSQAQKKAGKDSYFNEKKDNLVSLQREKLEEEIKRIKVERKLKELKYRKEREDLIEKESVATVIFQYLDALNINMLDVPDMVIDTMIDKIKAKAERGDLIKLMREVIQKAIVNTKSQIKERLK